MVGQPDCVTTSQWFEQICVPAEPMVATQREPGPPVQLASDVQKRLHTGTSVAVSETSMQISPAAQMSAAHAWPSVEVPAGAHTRVSIVVR